MFIGHYGVALAAKATAPDVPLVALMISTQIIDVIFCALVAAKVEKVEIDPTASATIPIRSIYMPFSHSLEAGIVISAATAFGASAFLPGINTGALWLIALVCFSHWIIDVIMHVRDIPVVTLGRKIGLGLWNNRPLSIALELGLIAAGTILLATLGDLATWKVWALGGAMFIAQAIAFFTPPPSPVLRMVGSMMVVYIVMTAGAWWIEPL